MSFLTDILPALGFRGELVLALSVGFVAWYLVKGLRVGKTAGSIIDTGVKMLAFAIGFLAVGIWRDWWDPAFSKLSNDGVTLIQMLIEYGTDLIDWVLQSGVAP